MKFIQDQIEYVKHKPIAVGVSAVLATLSFGMALSFALGFASPQAAFAQVLPPCCTIPVVPIVPIIPIVPVTPPPPPVVQPVITDTGSDTSTSDTSTDGQVLPPCCTIPDVPIVSPVTTPPTITPTPVTPPSVDTTDTSTNDQVLPPCCTIPDVPIVPVVPIVPITPPPVVPIVTPPPPPPPPVVPVCTLTLSASSVNANGTATLSWTSSNATSLSIDNGIGNVTPGGGSVPISPTQTTTYHATVSGAGGSTNCETTITVASTPPPPPACTLTLSVSSVQAGGSATLSWSAVNATSVSIDNGIGNVTPSGGSVTITPTQTTTYHGSVSGAGGSANCNTVITVTTTPPPPPPACTLTLSTSSIVEGDSATLSWTSTNTTGVSIDNGIGNVGPNGSVTIHPTQTTTYHGSVSGAGGSANCDTTITVTHTPPPPHSPICTLNLSVSSIDRGGSATLSWSSTDANSVTIDNGIGAVGPSGSLSISPTQTTTYTGTANGSNGTVSQPCSVTITVVPPPPPPGCVINCGGHGGGGGGGGHSNPVHVTLTQATSQPLSYVYLSQIPYTGLDLGPVGTFFYWLFLILWCAALAYLAVFKVAPYVLKQFKGFGSSVAHALNAETAQEESRYAYASPVAHAAPAFAHAPASYAPAAPAPVAQPAMQAAPAYAAPEAASTYSAYQGFRSFGRDGALTIDDIVKGLSRQPAQAPQAQYAAPQVEPVYENVEPIQAPAAPQYAPKAQDGQRAPHTPAPAAEVPQFIASVLAGNREESFGMIRSVIREGGDAESFLTQVAVALDDAYRARLDGTKVHPEIARVTEGCANSFLEKLATAFSTGVDSTYSQGITGAKLAVARALGIVEG